MTRMRPPLHAMLQRPPEGFIGVAPSATSSIQSTQTAPSPPGDGVVITYPVHPHFGEVLPVWRTYEGGFPRVVVELPEGCRRITPVEWTSRRPSVTCPRLSGRLVLFDVKRLLGAAAWAAEKLTAAIGRSSSRPASGEDADGASRGPVPRRETASAGLDPVRGGAAVDRGGGSKGTPRRGRSR
jgi:hypothetical protein